MEEGKTIIRLESKLNLIFMNREDKHTFLSIIIPVYNGLTHDLPICLESIWLQPLDPSQYEVICVDDCSTNDTRRWLDEEAAKHSFWEKCQSTMAFAAQKWEMSAVVMGEKMMTGIAKKISGYNL